MEPPQPSKSIDSSTKDPQLDSSPVLHHDHNDSQLSDLNHVTHLDEELQNKLDLKDEDQIHEKGSNFEAASVESDKGQECPNDDGWNGDDDDGWNGDDEVNDWVENVKENVDVSGEVGQVENKDERSTGNSKAELYPLRPEAEDCSFYLKTGTCKFGSNCKFNHPSRRRNPVSLS